MSARFWLFSLASAGVALTGGLGLGLYATTSPRVAMADAEMPLSAIEDSSAPAGSADLAGPMEISCKGCGPTLAQRQMASMMGGWSGYEDPVVRDYMAQAEDSPEDLLPENHPVPPPPARQLPASIERFAVGETAPAEPVQLAQGSRSGAGDVAMTAGEYYREGGSY